MHVKQWSQTQKLLHCPNIENKTWQNPYHMPYHPEKPISSRGPLGPRDDIGRG